MKKLYSIIPLLFLMALCSCDDNGPDIKDMPNEKIAFSYAIKGEFAEDFYIGSEIQFENLSAVTGKVTWDFGDGTTSNEMNPTHQYEKAKTYRVTLSIGEEGSNSAKILISDIFPVLSISCDDPICEVNQSQVSLSIFLPNPQNLEEKYIWSFPAGTKDSQGKEISTFEGENPGLLSFSNVGSQKIILKTTLGGRQLEDGMVNVQVGCSSPTKTLYYAVKDGNIMAYKLIADAPADMGIAPFDLGVKSGNHPMNILCDDSLIYVLDAGKQFNYINDTDGTLGDGKISVISKDGKTVETMISNSGKTAFNDPFYGYIDQTNRIMYIADRNTGFAQIPLDGRNLEMDRDKYPYFVQNNRLLYYNAAYAYGAMNANFFKINDIWYWAKTFNSAGIFRFKDSDIQSEDVKEGSKVKPYTPILSACFIKSMMIDAQRNLAYFVLRSGSTPGLYVCNKDVFDNLLNSVALEAAVKAGTCILVAEFCSDDLGSSGEYIDVCQMVLDKETGMVYFGLRAGQGSAYPSGIYACQVNNTSNPTKADITFKQIIKDVLIYGITINNKKSKLF